MALLPVIIELSLRWNDQKCSSTVQRCIIIMYQLNCEIILYKYHYTVYNKYNWFTTCALNLGDIPKPQALQYTYNVHISSWQHVPFGTAVHLFVKFAFCFKIQLQTCFTTRNKPSQRMTFSQSMVKRKSLGTVHETRVCYLSLLHPSTSWGRSCSARE